MAVLVIVGTFVFVLPQFANYGAVWDQVKMLSWAWVGILLASVLLNVVTFAPPWMAALPGLRFLQAETVTQASTAGTYLAPGGPVVGVGVSAAMLLAWGFHADEVALAVTLTGGSGAALQTVAIIGLAVFVTVAAAFAAALSSSKMARRVGDLAAHVVNRALRVVRRGPVGWTGESFVHFRSRAIGLLRRRWHVLTLATLAGQLSVFLVLLACLRALDVGPDQVTVVEAFAGWSLARVLGSIPITPGGLGVVELGLTSVLVGFGGNNAGVVAAVLLYRFLTIVPTLALGLAASLTWRRQRRPALASVPPENGGLGPPR